MTTDATTQLIQRITSQLSPSDATTQNSKVDLLSQLNSVVGATANYAQVLSTVEPVVIAAASSYAASVAATSAAAGETTAAAESAAVAGVAADGPVGGAIVIIMIAVVLAVATTLGGSANDDIQQELQQVEDALKEIGNYALGTYWDNKLESIRVPFGDMLKTDLGTIAAWGLNGALVTNSSTGITQFIKDASDFINNLTPDGGGSIYWQRPYDQSLLFTAQQVPYPVQDPPLWDMVTTMGWYGNLPWPKQLVTDKGGNVASDPRSILPYLSWGIGAYLTISALANLIDSTLPTFRDFLRNSQIQTTLTGYAKFFRSQFEMAVDGIEMSDMPTGADILSFAYYLIIVPTLSSYSDPGLPDERLWWGSFPYNGSGSCPSVGSAWNGVYGVVDRYGAYQAPVAVPSSSPAHLLDIFNTDNMLAEFQQAWGTSSYVEDTFLTNWVAPWVSNKVILGLMARWKAIYLINGYDKVWPVLQNLCFLAQQPLPPRQMIHLSSSASIIASENWSARELIKVLDVDGYILNGSLIAGGGPYGNYSLWSLVGAFDNIAKGNWAGPPEYSNFTFSGKGPTRPLGFRDRLAAAAV